MAIAVGIDLGGTKIEAQVFDKDWRKSATRRVDTPKDYASLIKAIAGLIHWSEGQSRPGIPVGIGAAGLVSPLTGKALTANLGATGQPLPKDISAAVGRDVTYLNDCRAFTLSEAVFGAARGRSPVMGLLIGTGLGGGFAVDGTLIEDPGGIGGEFGHMALPAPLVIEANLPLFDCGCGRRGCYETLVSGPGLEKLVEYLTGQRLIAPRIAERRGQDGALDAAWDLWIRLLAELIWSLSVTIDPEVVVLGGGLSDISGLVADTSQALDALMWTGFPPPQITRAEGGETSGARGAAYAAWRAVS